MIAIACWKWRRISTGHQLPNVVDYGDRHVRVLQSMLARHVTIPYRFVCITDEPVAGVECLPLWETYPAGGCYHRLRVFDPDFDWLGERFAWIDLDAVIVGSLDPLLTVDADFAIHQYAYRGRAGQHYNGGFVVMNRGARPQVWQEFDPVETPALMAELNRHRHVIGSDQAWISHVLGGHERKFTTEDGVYEAMPMEKKRRPQPENARIVLFSGPRDPSRTDLAWARSQWT